MADPKPVAMAESFSFLGDAGFRVAVDPANGTASNARDWRMTMMHKMSEGDGMPISETDELGRDVVEPPHKVFSPPCPVAIKSQVGSALG
jgi:hypothetical protein